MKKSFQYKEKYSWGFLFLAAVGIAGIAYSFIESFNIRLGSKTILEYPNSKYAIWAVGTLFILYAVHKWMKMKAVNGSDAPILFSENELTFNYVSGYSLSRKKLVFSEVNELWNNTDKDDGESMILYTENSKNRYEFFAENFSAPGEFAEFKQLLEMKCTTITNRD